METKYTPEAHARAVEAIRGGNYLETAAALAGVTAPTLRAWIRRGRDPEGEEQFQRLARDVDSAMAEAEETALKTIIGSKDPKWVAWWLERARADRWGQKVEVRIRQTAVDKILDRLKSRLPPEVFDAAMAALAEDAVSAPEDDDEDGED